MTIRIVVADDHELVRQGIEALLLDTDIEVIAHATNGDQAVRLTLELEPQVVLLDVRMPDGDGLTALGRIKLDRPHTPVLMHSAYDNPTYIARAVALGASGYVLKSEPRSALIDKIRVAASGETTWNREELRRVTGALASPRPAADTEIPFTRRESEVLERLAAGMTNKEIARALNISYETVKEHVQHLLRKIGVSDRTQAAVWAVRNGVV